MNGNKFIVDNLRFSYSPLSIRERFEVRMEFGPNPATDKMYFPQLKEPVYIEVYNSYGILIKSALVNPGSCLDISDCIPGLYYMKSKSSQNNILYSTEKFIKL
jgi:hypothetical protein